MRVVIPILQIIFVFHFLPLHLNGQFYTDFSSQNLDGWSGDTIHFTISEGEELQLNAFEEGTSTIFHHTDIETDTIVWQGKLRMEFAPSDANNLTYFLYLNDTSNTMQRSIYLEVGENGSEDALDLVFNNEEGNTTSFRIGTSGSMSKDPAEVFFEILATKDGIWKFRAAYDGSDELMEEDSINHSLSYWPTNSYLGLQCQYTQTRKDKFFFDELYVGPPIRDTIMPRLDSLVIPDSLQITLFFSEAMEENQLLDPSNYTLMNGPNIAWVDLAGAGWNQAVLGLSAPLINEELYTLQIQGLTDKAGNVLSDSVFEVIYYQFKKASSYDIIITEVMADPEPQVLLPNAEYLEVLNRTQLPIKATGWKLIIDDHESLLQPKILLPDEYVIICDPEDRILFSNELRFWIPDRMPIIKNTGAVIQLLDDTGEVIDYFHFLKSKHTHQDKNEGGWSLELTSITDPCRTDTIWRSSRHPSGGTPGAANSINRKISYPATINAPSFYIDSNKLILTFDDKIQLNTQLINQLQFSPQLDVDSSKIIIDQKPSWLISLTEPPNANIIYQVEWKDSLLLCNGEKVIPEDFKFALPAQPAHGDLIINEVLFDPEKNGSDFIELLNTGDYPIDISQIIIRKTCFGTFEHQALNIPRILMPGSFLCLTEDPEYVKARYSENDPAAIVRSEIPTMPNEKGCLSLFYKNGIDLTLIDSIYYHETFHHSLLSETEGISLERINLDSPAIYKSDWLSAASNIGSASPGTSNSQLIDSPDQTMWYDVISKTFSPDQDGFEDYFLVNVHPNRTAGTLYAAIYSMDGNLLNILEDNVMIGKQHIVRWDGTTANGSALKPGPYIMHLRLLWPDGKVQQTKFIATLAKFLK